MWPTVRVTGRCVFACFAPLALGWSGDKWLLDVLHRRARLGVGIDPAAAHQRQQWFAAGHRACRARGAADTGVARGIAVASAQDRKRAVSGKSVSECVDIGGGRVLIKKS